MNRGIFIINGGMENFDYTHDNYQVFKMFNDDWAIVCAGDITIIML